MEIEKRREILVLEIGVNRNANFQIQSVLACSVTRRVTTVKSVRARKGFTQAPEAKKQRWDSEF